MTSTTIPTAPADTPVAPAGAEPQWRAALRLVAPAAMLTLLVPSLWLRLGGGGSDLAVSAVVSALHSLLAAWAAVTVLRPARRLEGRARAAWGLIGAGISLWSVSNTLWLIGYATGANPHGARSVPAFTITNAVLLAGAVLLPASRWRVARVRALDTAIMVVAALSLMWVLPLTHLLRDAAGDHPTLTFAALCAVKVLSVLVAMGAFVRCRPDERNETPPLAFALIVLAVGDTLFAAGGRVGYPVEARIADALVTATLLLLAVAGARLAGPPRPVVEPERRRSAPFALPELCTVVAVVALALERQFRNDGSLGVSVGLAATLVVLAIVRLGLLEHEQRRLATSLRSSADRLYRHARGDNLTGLGNRTSLDEQLARAAARSVGSGGDLVSLFYIDVDHFKRFNDGLGHHAGDELLVEMSRRLRDVFGDDAVHRVGGDEFVALRRGIDARTAEVLACDTVSVAAQPITVDGHELNCTVSVGVAQMAPAALDPSERPRFADTLLRRADLALYGAKERGRNTWAAYDPSLQQRADQRLHLQQQLHRAIERGELEVHHQPVVELATGLTVGLGAGLRWRSQRGLLGPESFLQTVIDGGMLPQVFACYFTGIATALQEVDRRGLHVRWVTAPMRREEIVHPGLVESITEALGSAGVHPGRLRIAVPEDTVVDDAALDVIHELRRLGVQVAVHRFGTGPSSLLRLGQYPATSIAVDESFVEGLGRRHDDTVIVTAVAGLTADLGMELCAEGVTEQFQVELLTRLGCTLGQGRHFGEHAPLDQVLDARPAMGAR